MMGQREKDDFLDELRPSRLRLTFPGLACWLVFWGTLMGTALVGLLWYVAIKTLG